MKILFFGHKGWIGNQFLDILLKNNIEVILTSVRADDEKNVENEINTHKPTHIVSFIGRTHGEGINSVDYLEQPGKLKENICDNLYAPIVLSILSSKYKIHYTYIGTGCIFNDNDHLLSSYTETDIPNFYGSSYSIVKGYTDRLQHMFNDNTLNLRIRMPITNFKHPRNFISKIVGYDNICSMTNSMSVLPDLLPIIFDMMQNKLTGTFNMINKGVISHDEILNIYKTIIDSTLKWSNITLEEQNNILKSKRSNCQLNSNKLYELYPNIPDIHTSVKNCIENMKNDDIKIQYYLIHGNDPLRKQHMIDSFKRCNIDNEKVKWILHPNKDEIDDEFIAKNVISGDSYSNGFNINAQKELTKGQIACTYKHFLCLENIIENQYEYAIIMEDNMYIIDDVPKIISKYINQLNELYPDWDILFDYNQFKYIYQPIKKEQIVYPKSNNIEYGLHGSTRAATFYLLNLKCAKKLYDNYIPFHHQSDFWMNDLFRKLNINSFWSEPSNVAPWNHISTTKT